MAFEAPFYIPSGKTKIDIGTWIWYISASTIIAAPLLSLLFKFNGILNSVLNVITYSAIFTWFLNHIINYFRHKPLNGEIKGTLKMDETKISFGERIIKYDDIIDFNLNKYFDFTSLDYYNKFPTTNVGPALSQGVRNEIHLKTNQGEVIVIHFRINSKQHGLELKPIIRIMAIKKKISLNRAIGILQLNNKEVRELKAEM